MKVIDVIIEPERCRSFFTFVELTIYPIPVRFAGINLSPRRSVRFLKAVFLPESTQLYSRAVR